MTHNLFVYGTLMEGFYNNRFLPQGAERVGVGTIAGMLLDLGSFPGLKRYPVKGACVGTVKGEVYRVADFDSTDKLEGYRPDEPKRSFYVREVVQVTLEDGTVIDAQTYVYNVAWHACEDRAIIADGDWRAEEARREVASLLAGPEDDAIDDDEDDDDDAWREAEEVR